MPFYRSLEEMLADGFLITSWPQGPKIGPSFMDAESSFVFGAVHTGKTRLLVRLAKMYQKHGLAQILDAFGAENDSESTVWVLDPETRDNTLMVVGNEVLVEGWDMTMPIGEFTLEKAKQYDVIVTDRSLFGPRDDRKWDFRYYAALSRMFELAKRREGQQRLLAVVIREAWNVIYSQMKSGISRDEQAAQGEFRKMHNQRFHARVAALIDTQRYTDLSASVRSLTDYRYIKGFGSQTIPAELHFLFQPQLFGYKDWLIRNTPLDEFILLTGKNGVARGTFADIPWHIKKGYSPLRKLGVNIRLKSEVSPGESEEDGSKDPWEGANYVPSNNDIHRRMKELHDAGYSYKDVASKMEEEGVPMSWQKVRYHLQGNCACEVTSEAPQTPSGPMDQLNQTKALPPSSSAGREA